MLIAFYSLLLLPVVSLAANTPPGNVVTSVDIRAHGLTATISIEGWSLEASPDGMAMQIPGAMLDGDGLPVLTRWVTAPRGERPVATLTPTGASRATGLVLNEGEPAPPYCDVSEPVLFRGIPLYALRVRPCQVTPDGEVMINEHMELEVTYEEYQGGPQPSGGPVRVSEETYRMLESMCLNLDELDLIVTAPLGRILIVVPEYATVIGALTPYVQWKTELGYEVEISPIENNDSRYQIASLIEEAYNDESAPPLDHVLLIGDNGNGVSDQFDMACGNNYGDYSYTLLSGDDNVGDVSIGRFSVRDLQTMMRVVNKTIFYERDVYLEDPTWLNNAVLTAGSGSGYSVVTTNQTLSWNFQRRGLTVDSLWYTMGGNIPDFIVNEVNEGASFVNFRGYYGMSGWSNNDNAYFSNDTRMPVFVTITCGTGSWSTEATTKSEGIFRAGSGVNGVQGAVACIGTATTHTHTRFNNVVDAGFFDAALTRNIRSVGWALVQAKIRLIESYQGTNDNTQSLNYTHWNNLMGDPALRMWVGEPDQLTVTHPSSLQLGQNHIDVHAEAADNADLPFTWATVSAGGEVLDCRRLDANGNARLIMDDSDVDNIVLVVAGDNIAPYRTTLARQHQGASIVYNSVDIDDNDPDDETNNPGETLYLALTVRNEGITAGGGEAVVTCEDPFLELISGDSFTIPQLNVNETYTRDEAIVVTVAPACPDGAIPSLTLTVNDCTRSAIPIPIQAWAMVAEGEPDFDNDAGHLMPGESSALSLPIRNMGSLSSSQLVGRLSTLSPSVSITTSEVWYPALDPDETGSNTNDPFSLQIVPEAGLGEPVDLVLELESDNGAVDSVRSRFYIGDPREHGATGPDSHGYWALDSADDSTLFALVPNFFWFNINGLGTELDIEDTYDEDDASVTVDLPFSFYYYGNEYDQLTVCSNGWAAFGSCPNFTNFRNYTIPGPNGPPAMVAPLWDDLRTAGAGNGIWIYHQEESGFFIVQWNVQSAYNNTQEDFQLILMDPGFYPTQTGNGRLLFLYDTVTLTPNSGSDNDYATIGIENPDQTDGVLYSYWSDYTPGSAELVDGMAILFTDDLASLPNPPEAVIEPAEGFELVLAGSETLTDSIIIANADGGLLRWSLSAYGNVVPTQLRREQMLRTSRTHAPRGDTTTKPDQRRNKGRNTAGSLRVDPAVTHFQRMVKGDEGVGGPPELDDAGGPDAFGYIWRDSNEPDGPTYNWHSNFGTEITTFTPDADDGFSDAIPLPFAFSFYGEDYDELYVNTNGYLTFIGDQDPLWANRLLPDNTANQAMIGVWWDDMNLIPGEDGGGEIYVWDDSDSMVVVTWDGVLGWGDRGGPYTFQAILKANGCVTFQYQDMGPPDDERHDEATIGMQNENGTTGLTVVHNWDGYIENELAIELFVPSYWFSFNPANGFALQGEFDAVTLTVHGEDIPFGEYQGMVTVRSNAENIPTLDIPITLHALPTGYGPYITGIREQVIEVGESFDVVDLNEAVVDPNYPVNQLDWDYAGNEHLIVQINDGLATLTPLDDEWTGTETITFIATNPENLSDSSDAAFSIVTTNLPPDSFALRQPGDNSTQRRNLVHFLWNQAEDPEGMEVGYTFEISSEGDTVRYEDLSLFALALELDTLDLPDNGGLQQTYSWQVIASDPRGRQRVCNAPFSFNHDLTAQEEPNIFPAEFAISEAWPNPFNATVSVEVALPEVGDATMRVIDILGRTVTTLSHRSLAAGYHTLTWDAARVASGVYFLKLEVGPLETLRKVTLIR